MAALKFTGIILLLYFTGILAKPRRKFCKEVEQKLESIETLIEHLDCSSKGICTKHVFLFDFFGSWV